MKERERIIATGLTVLMLILWLGFLVHRSPRFAGSLAGGMLAIAGGLLMLVPLAYAAVKRIKRLKKTLKPYVSMRTLLTWHVYAGIVGPILVLLHTGHKFVSPLGIALTGMTLLVVVSGFAGRYLMNQFSTEIREQKAMLQQLEAAYQERAGQWAREPERATLLRPFTGILGRLAAALVVRETTEFVPGIEAAPNNPAMLLRLTDAMADLEYAIKTHETFKKWFAKWLKFHIVISVILYVLMAFHVWAAIHFGLRWFELSGTRHFAALDYQADQPGNQELSAPAEADRDSTTERSLTSPTEMFSTHFGSLFRRYWRPEVTIHGIRTTVFDYAGIARESAEAGSDFSAAVTALEQVEPESLGSENAEKAFWINVYNFVAMKLAAEHYPVPSIVDPKISEDDPWSVPAVHVGQSPYSLTQIENVILLKKFNDPRIVFAISCAAVSCPDRTDEIFSAERIDEQLDTIIRGLLANPTKGLLLDRDRNLLKLSWILKADRRLFGGTDQGVIQFVRRYATDDVAAWLAEHSEDVTVEYFDHDWSLNDVALADRR